MHPKEFETVIKLPAPKRYEYFIKKVVGFKQVWGLYDDGWATTENDDGVKLVPFWPKKEFAQVNATEEWFSYQPESIDLEEFLEEWIPKMMTGGYGASIFRTPEGLYVEVNLNRLKEDLESELSKYE